MVNVCAAFLTLMKSKMNLREESLRIVEDYEILVGDLFDNLSSFTSGKLGSNGDKIINSCIEKITDKDKQLASSVYKVKKHQEANERIQRVQSITEEKDQSLLKLASEIKRLEQELNEEIFQFKDIHESSKHKVDLDEVVAYAHRIALTTSAPFGYNEKTNNNLGRHKLPFPSTAQIYHSILFEDIPAEELRQLIIDSNADKDNEMFVEGGDIIVNSGTNETKDLSDAAAITSEALAKYNENNDNDTNLPSKTSSSGNIAVRSSMLLQSSYPAIQPERLVVKERVGKPLVSLDLSDVSSSEDSDDTDDSMAGF